MVVDANWHRPTRNLFRNSDIGFVKLDRLLHISMVVFFWKRLFLLCEDLTRFLLYDEYSCGIKMGGLHIFAERIPEELTPATNYFLD